MRTKISKDRVVSQMDSKSRAEYLKNEIRSNKGKPEDILNFKHYFNGFKLIEGIHGPEEVNSKIYLSVFHFMEYEGINPHDFDTISIGGYLSKITSDYKFCVYSDFPHKINKYEYSFLVNNKSIFSNYQKANQMCQSEITFFDIEFVKDVTTTLIGASIGTITAVVIYIGTNKKERKREKEKSHQESKNRLLYTSNLLENFKIKLDDTNKSLSTLISQFKNDPIRFHLPVIAINESSSLLNEMLKSERTFVSHNEFFGVESIKNYNNLRNEVSFFEIQMDQLTDMNIRAKDYDFQRKKEVMEMINHIMRDLINIYDVQQISKQEKEEIFRFSVEFERKLTDKADVKFYYESYLTPLMNLLLEHSSDEVVLGVISQIKSSMIIYQHIEANSKAHLINLENIYEEMSRLSGNFEIDSKHILTHFN